MSGSLGLIRGGGRRRPVRAGEVHANVVGGRLSIGQAGSARFEAAHHPEGERCAGSPVNHPLFRGHTAGADGIEVGASASLHSGDVVQDAKAARARGQELVTGIAIRLLDRGHARLHGPGRQPRQRLSGDARGKRQGGKAGQTRTSGEMSQGAHIEPATAACKAIRAGARRSACFAAARGQEDHDLHQPLRRLASLTGAAARTSLMPTATAGPGARRLCDSPPGRAGLRRRPAPREHSPVARALRPPVMGRAPAPHPGRRCGATSCGLHPPSHRRRALGLKAVRARGLDARPPG